MVDKISLNIAILIFSIGSIGDVFTTHIGYSNGFGELSPIVRYFMDSFGSLYGVIISKLLALSVILVLSVTVAYIYSYVSESKDFKKMCLETSRDLLLVAGIIYIGATMNNLLILYLL